MHEILNTKCKSLKEVYEEKYPSSSNPVSCVLSVNIDLWPILVTGYEGNQTLDWSRECLKEAVGENKQVEV